MKTNVVGSAMADTCRSRGSCQSTHVIEAAVLANACGQNDKSPTANQSAKAGDHSGWLGDGVE